MIKKFKSVAILVLQIHGMVLLTVSAIAWGIFLMNLLIKSKLLL